MARRSEHDSDGLFELPPAHPVAPRQPPSRTNRARHYENYRQALKDRRAELLDDRLQTEGDIDRLLGARVWTVQQLYKAVEDAGLAERDNGFDVVQDGQFRYQRRVRNALQHMKRRGEAVRLGGGQWMIDDRPAPLGESAAWLIEGTPQRPEYAQLVVAGELSHISVMLGEAETAMKRWEEAPQMIFCDPPYDLGVGEGANVDPDRFDYARNSEHVLPGYVEAPKDKTYEQFCADWIGPAAEVLKDAGYLVVVTGPQQSGIVQYVGQQQGLTYVNKVAVQRPFPVRTTRRMAHSHWDVTVFTNGPLRNPRRYFDSEQADFEPSASGMSYMRDMWTDIGKYERPGRVRNANALPPLLPDRFLRMLTRERDLAAELFMGSGPLLLSCLVRNRRYIGVDLNPNALRFAMARTVDIAEQSVQLGHQMTLDQRPVGLDLQALVRPMWSSNPAPQLKGPEQPTLKF